MYIETTCNEYESKPFERRPECEAAQIAGMVRPNEARAFCGDELHRSWPYEQPS